LGWSRNAKTASQVSASVVVAVGLVAAWEAVVRLGGYPTYIIPRPTEVAAKALQVVRNGTLWQHTLVTAQEVLLGLAIGVSLALVVGYLLSTSQWFERVLSPYIVAAQSVPTVALAPLLVIWFGFGMSSKVAVCAMVVFFPMMVSTLVGFSSVPEDLRDLMVVMRANRWQVLTKLQVPAALPVLLGGLRLAVTLAVVGAVVGEFVGADRGLGFLVNMGKGIFDTPLMFVALLALMLMAMALYVGVLWLEHKLLKWRY